ncbi:MAG TPA: LuxR C-terminal-related transcriptional regulator [Streptosporangiaceae bacterium]|nr:LuxR C-terminal-related transcriptional regulator [Streptosporangiaceae bacterium]
MTVNFPDAAGQIEVPGNLPAEPNAFIGRERDLADLVAMLGHVRALTLCGPGGIGKTRLALKLAASLASDYPDGAWITDLADADAAERLVPLVAATLGIHAEPDQPLSDTLAEALRPRTMLLVLDTCEHLIEAAAELVQRLLGLCPHLRVIATSREALRVRGEVIWRVPPLGLPARGDGDLPTEAVAGSEAVRLFVARASAVRRGFSLSPGNIEAVADICRTLDGVPLAIELAAARTRTLSAEQIRLRLARRFELLALGDRTAPARQQTLRATVEWSYDLLTPPERKLLSRLAVFHAWSLDMAEQVCADDEIPARDVLDLLTTLIDKSLVIVDGELNGDGRYRLLDTVAELAAEIATTSGELPALAAAHRDCMLAMAESIAARAYVRGDPPWHERVAMYHRALAERPNFHLALGYCEQQGEAEAGLRICDALSGSWLASGDVAEGADWIDRLLAITAQVRPHVRARALAVRAELAFEQLDFEGAARHAAACLELSKSCGAGNPATALRLQALIMLMAGRADDALAQADAALDAARRMADDWETGVALASRAAVLAGCGRVAEAGRGYTEALDVLSDNNRWGLANVLYGLGQLARGRGDTAAALRYFSDALAIYRQIDAKPEMARCLGGIGLVAMTGPDPAAARTALAESVRLNLATGQRLGIARGLGALAALWMRSGEQERAIRVAAAARAIFEAIGVQPAASAVRRLDELISSAPIEPEKTSALVSEGKAMSVNDAVRVATIALAGSGTAQASTAQASTAQAGAPPASPDAGTSGWPGPLTDREQEVALLISDGLSNKEIADRLSISAATAARHIANIFVKLSVSSRAQLTAWVFRSAGPRHDDPGANQYRSDWPMR